MNVFVFVKPQQPSSSVLGMSWKLTQNVTYWITDTIPEVCGVFPFTWRFSAKQKSGSHSSCCDNGCYHSLWENATELRPLQNWSFLRPKEKCALTVGRELFWIPKPYQLVLKLKNSLWKLSGSQCEAQWHSGDWVILKNINWALKISCWQCSSWNASWSSTFALLRGVYFSTENHLVKM